VATEARAVPRPVEDATTAYPDCVPVVVVLDPTRVTEGHPVGSTAPHRLEDDRRELSIERVRLADGLVLVPEEMGRREGPARAGATSPPPTTSSTPRGDEPPAGCETPCESSPCVITSRPESGHEEESEAAIASGVLPRIVELAKRSGELPWRRLLLGAWSLAGLAGALWILLAWSRLFSFLRNRSEVTDGPALDALAALCRRAGVRGRVRLSTSPTLPGPITLGILRREICLPERALAALSAAQVRAMLAHELAHVVRRDALRFHALAFLERVFFFQPLNRVARRRLHETAEILCDDLAVRWTDHRLALASCLTEIARWMVGGRRVLPAPGMAHSRSRLGQRVERLLDDRRSPRPERRHRWFPPLATVLVGVVVAAVPGFSGAASPVVIEEALEREEIPEHAAVEPSVEPTARPADVAVAEEPAPALLDPETLTTSELLAQNESLEVGLASLEAEVALVRSQLEEMELADHLGDPLERIDQRVRSLRARRDRVAELLAKIAGALETTHHDSRFSVPEERP